MLDRRRFLQASSLATSSVVAGCTASGASARHSTPKEASRAARLGPGTPRRIIHLVADGMSLGTLSCADQLSLLERKRHLTWINLWSRPDAHTALMDMRSLDSLVTDSAAAASSWGSGCRVKNGTVNVSSKGHKLTPLLSLFGQAGWKRGLVTTTEITHATPAGFTVSVDSRGEQEKIADQYLERRVEVLLGGARDHFDPAKRKDKRDLWAAFAAAGYQVAKTRADLLNASSDLPLLGTFTGGHLPYTLDHQRDRTLRETVPTLPEMAAAALRRLEPHDRFILQIEAGRVDHACHNNDAAGALRDQLTADETLDLVLDFQGRHPETLVIVTTDHGNANLGLNGMGTSYRDSSKAFDRVANVRASFPEILKKLKEATTEKAATAILAETTGYKVDPKKLVQFLPFLSGKGSALFDQMNSDVAALGQLLANHLGVGFVGTTHTSDYVPLIAVGPGSDRFRGMIRNTDVFTNYTSLAAIDFRNPQEPLLAEVTHAGDAEDTRAYAHA
ncbi:MAG: alkaline phosphatase [Verrucomicrobiales bacterium]|nr:alkaline phosphatase [Verrucomicrobiales bacterium]